MVTTSEILKNPRYLDLSPSQKEVFWNSLNLENPETARLGTTPAPSVSEETAVDDEGTDVVGEGWYDRTKRGQLADLIEFRATRKQVGEGLDWVRSGLKEASEFRGPLSFGKGVGKTLLGTLGVATSPLAEIGGLISGTARKAGVDPGVSDWAGLAGEILLPMGWMKIPKVAKGLGLLKNASKQSRKTIKTKEVLDNFSPPKVQGLDFGGVTRDVPWEAILRKPKQSMVVKTDKLSKSHEEEVIDMFKKAVLDGKVTPDESNRLFRQVGSFIGKGIKKDDWIQSRDDLQRFLGLSSSSQADNYLAHLYMGTVSESGRHLQRLSKLSKDIHKMLGPDAKRILQLDNLKSNWLLAPLEWLEKIRRPLLVSAPKVAMRNLTSQMGRAGLGQFDEAVQGVLRVASGSKVTTAFQPLVNDLLAFTRAAGRKGSKGIRDALENMSVVERKLMQNPVGYMRMGKFANFINGPNKAQEAWFRRVAFESRFRTNLQNFGGKKYAKSFNDLTPEDFAKFNLSTSGTLEHRIISDAIRHSHDLTFAAMPSSKSGQALLTTLSNPLLTAFGNPFPRFFMNALNFLYDFSPAGITRLLNPKTVSQISKTLIRPLKSQMDLGVKSDIIKTLSRSMLGTTMLASAGAIRESDWAGENYWELKTGPDRVIDLRPFAPFSSYLFIWDALFNPEKLDGKDWLYAAVGMNRIGGTGLAVIDAVRGEMDIRRVKKVFSDIAGNYMSGFATPIEGWITEPARSVHQWVRNGPPPIFRPKDLNLEIHESLTKTPRDEERIEMFSAREDPITGPTRRRLPLAAMEDWGISDKIEEITGLKVGLPEKRSLFTEGPIGPGKYDSLWRSVGLSLRDKSVLQREVDKLNVNYAQLFPRTGEPKLDRLIINEMGSLLDKHFKPVIKTKSYQDLETPAKRIVFSRVFSRVKKAALQRVARHKEYHSLIIEYRKKKKYSKDVRELIEMREGVGPD